MIGCKIFMKNPLTEGYLGVVVPTPLGKGIFTTLSINMLQYICMNVKQKKADKEFEKIEAMGTDDHKAGVKATKEIVTQELKEKQESQELTIEYLKNKARFKKIDYNRSLVELLYIKLAEDQMPKGVSYNIAPTDIGVYMELYIKGRMFNQAFKATGMPKYDLNAVNVFVARTEEMVSKLCLTETQ